MPTMKIRGADLDYVEYRIQFHCCQDRIARSGVMKKKKEAAGRNISFDRPKV